MTNHVTIGAVTHTHGNLKNNRNKYIHYIYVFFTHENM